ncbi:MAG: hypothetical protein WCO45_09850 [Pseudanabaena sp. ELA607]
MKALQEEVRAKAAQNTCNASVESKGLMQMFSANIEYFKAKPVNIIKIIVLVDHGYHPEYLRKELEKIYPQIMIKSKF